MRHRFFLAPLVSGIMATLLLRLAARRAVFFSPFSLVVRRRDLRDNQHSRKATETGKHLNSERSQRRTSRRPKRNELPFSKLVDLRIFPGSGLRSVDAKFYEEVLR